MTSFRALLGFALVALAASAACSSDDGGDDPGAESGGSAGTGAGDAAADSVTQGCVQPGDHGNDIGVGEFCSPGGGQCPATAPLCLAEAAPGEDQWFCTRLCTAETNCGADAFCLMEGRGAACVPNRCVDDAGG